MSKPASCFRCRPIFRSTGANERVYLVREEKVFSSTQYVARREIKIARGSVFRFIRSNSSSVREALS